MLSQVFNLQQPLFLIQLWCKLRKSDLLPFSWEKGSDYSVFNNALIIWQLVMSYIFSNKMFWFIVIPKSCPFDNIINRTLFPWSFVPKVLDTQGFSGRSVFSSYLTASGVLCYHRTQSARFWLFQANFCLLGRPLQIATKTGKLGYNSRAPLVIIPGHRGT